MKIEVKLDLDFYDNDFDDGDFNISDNNIKIKFYDNIKNFIKKYNLNSSYNIDNLNNSQLVELFKSEYYDVLNKKIYHNISSNISFGFLDFILFDIIDEYNINVDINFIKDYFDDYDNYIISELNFIDDIDYDNINIIKLLNDNSNNNVVEYFNTQYEEHNTVFVQNYKDYISDNYIYEYLKILNDINYDNGIITFNIDTIIFNIK
jgi:hypothetical protein